MLPESIRTIEMREPGKADVLETGTRPIPQPASDEVLIKVIAAGVNGPDLVQRRGHYPPPKGASDLLGLEVSGEIVAVGADVADWSTGDLVCALTNGGGYAEYVTVHGAHCLPIPEGVDPVDAAGLPETYFTVWSNLFLDHTPAANALLLAHGGAGGIGSTAIQLGKLNGMSVLTTCADDASIAFCTDIGADRAINYQDEDFVAVARDMGGANLILDTIGGDYVARNIKASAPDARIVQLAFNKGSRMEIDLMPIMLKRLTFTGSTLRSRPEAFKSRVAADLRDRVWSSFQTGQLKPMTHTIFSFDEAVASHKMMEQAQHHGKILLKP
ncbi:NAD(P)H-quinone oxidoreductase [Coralliovum pocilloporae]|uniref:NAD(P)H-quinone oxidoreductase n=1 Tax=Coralliovum pocilloporae TaxID=3066369 RepID=UPI0033079F98